ncbi:MAG: hypothetical protein DRJ42_14280 [Deltaproteobacteria bacterium]|nr:MAG: hypothetical protein DRJ42_14280 [Deltaproteobacteria bacterium]
MFRVIPFFAVVVLSLVGACAAAEPTADEQCAELTASIRSCYPELPADAACTPEIIDRYQAEDFDAMSCESIDAAGKADVFSFGGCGVNEHQCGFLFCCDHGINWEPTGDADWQIIDIVDAFQDDLPLDIAAEFDGLTRDDVLDVYSVTYEQSVDDGLHGGPHLLAVEHTQGIVAVSLEDFLARVPADRWGVELDHYLGGEVQVHETDAEGRVVRQVERMVLSPLPIDIHTPANADMTKVEHIVYGDDAVTVYWRVMYSDNLSTETDVGSVSFIRHGVDETLVVFHSAHKLSALGVPLANSLARASLGPFFSDHVRHYRGLVE